MQQTPGPRSRVSRPGHAPAHPTVCVVNAVDTLLRVAGRGGAADRDAATAECFAQQDQALMWGPADKLLVTGVPIAELRLQADLLGLPEPRNLTPAAGGDTLFAAVAADRRLTAALADHAGERRRFTLLPHTTTPELWEFAETMRARHGVIAELPESTPDQGLRDLLDTKHGLRDLVRELGLADAPCRVATGTHCATPAEVPAAADRLLGRGRHCIVKADRGEASVGLLVFGPGDSPREVARQVAASPYYGSDPIVVEEYITGDGVEFPSVEYVVPADPAAPPRLTHACAMLFDGPTRLRGNVTSPELAGRAWYPHFVTSSGVIARELQHRGYRGHFGIDAVARPDGETFMLDLNARRTGSTHVHDFGVHAFGARYGRRWTVGNHDFYGLPPGLPAREVLALLGPLVGRPRSDPSGVVPGELTGLATGRLGSLVYASSMGEFQDLVGSVLDRIRQG